MSTLGRKEEGGHREPAIFPVVCVTKMPWMAPGPVCPGWLG